MKDLFGDQIPQKSSGKKKIHAAKKQEPEKQLVRSAVLGLNSIYKDFGNYIINERGNKTP